MPALFFLLNLPVEVLSLQNVFKPLMQVACIVYNWKVGDIITSEDNTRLMRRY